MRNGSSQSRKAVPPCDILPKSLLEYILIRIKEIDFNILVVDLYTNITELDNFKQTALLEATKVLQELGEQVKTEPD